MEIKDISSSTQLRSLLSEVYSYLSGEIKEMFEVGVIDYLNDKSNKICLVKTFIFPEKRNFYDVYFPLTLKGKKRSFSSDQILRYLFEYSNTSAIVGIAGSGKTMLMKHVFLSFCNTWEKIPVFIELRDLNNFNISFDDFLISIINKNKIKPDRRLLDKALQSGKFIFILDGYDEISLSIKSRVTQEIEAFVDQYHGNFYLFSSRPGTNIESFPRLMVYSVKELNKSEIDLFIERQLLGTDDSDIIINLKETIAKKENDSYLGYVKNPLLLSMFILTYKNYPELPRSKNKFYWNVFDTLCTKHDSVTKKGAYSHEKKTNLQSEDFERILKAFCYISIAQNRFNFDKQYLVSTLRDVRDKLRYSYEVEDLIYDLSVAISILTEEGLDYKFPHRTLQDYFAVLFVREQAEDAKRIIYTEKLLMTNAASFLHNKDFFELILELDKISFLEFVVIPILEKFNIKYSDDSILKNAVLIIKETGLAATFDNIGGNYSFNGGGSRKSVDYLEIGGMYNVRFLFHPYATNDFKKEISTFIQKSLEEYYTNDIPHINSLPVSLLSDHLIMEYLLLVVKEYNINQYFMSMKTLLNDLKKELKLQQEMSTGIWNF